MKGDLSSVKRESQNYQERFLCLIEVFTGWTALNNSQSYKVIVYAISFDPNISIICQFPFDGPSCSGNGVKASRWSFGARNSLPFMLKLVGILTSLSLNKVFSKYK